MKSFSYRSGNNSEYAYRRLTSLGARCSVTLHRMSDVDELYDDPFFKEAKVLHPFKYLIPVRDQGRCSCCTSCAVCDLIAFIHAKEHDKKAVPLSVQHANDCGCHNLDPEKEPDSVGCKTASMRDIFGFARGGITVEEGYNFVGSKEACKCYVEGDRLCIDEMLSFDAEAARVKIYEHPFVASIAINQKLKDHRGDEGLKVFIPPPPPPPPPPGVKRKEKRHAILVFGHGTSIEGLDYYYIKNSYGVDWGYKGFAKVICSSLKCFRYCSGVKRVTCHYCFGCYPRGDMHLRD